MTQAHAGGQLPDLTEEERAFASGFFAGSPTGGSYEALLAREKSQSSQRPAAPPAVPQQPLRFSPPGGGAEANLRFIEAPTSAPRKPIRPTTPLARRWIDRVRDFPQTSLGEGPHDPLPVPFTSDEVRTAVKKVQQIRPGPTIPVGITSAEMFIAEHVAGKLESWGRSSGWVRSSGRSFHLGGKLYKLRHRGNPRVVDILTPSGQPLPGVIPYDIDEMTTTFDLLGPRVQDPTAAVAPGPRGAPFAVPAPLARDLVRSTPQPYDRPRAPRPTLGARSNMQAYFNQTVQTLAVMDGAYVDPGSVVADRGTQGFEAASGQESAAPLLSLVNYFPIMQTHSIKGDRKPCRCANKRSGESCRC